MNVFIVIKKRLVILKNWLFRLSLVKKMLLIGVLLLIGWFGRSYVLGSSTTKTTYQTGVVTSGTLITNITASGSITSGNTSSISSSATGVVKEVMVANGDYVTQGDTIAILSLDQSSLQKQTAAYASYLSAQNSFNAAKSKMNSLQSALFKANQAFVKDKGITAPSDAQKADPIYIEENADWLQAESDYNNQKGVIAAAETAVASAWLSYVQNGATITAPMSGTVQNLTLTPGMAIASSSNSSSSTSSSASSYGNISLTTDQVQASVNLSEIDVTKVKVGQKVTMTMDAFPDKTFTGKVSAINTNGSVSSGVTTYPTTITFDSALPTMYPNMGVSSTIITKVKDTVLLVPSSAIQTQNGVTSLQVLRNGTPQQVEVEIGDSSDTQTEIITGVKEGDEIVTSTISSSSSSTKSGTTASPFGGTGFGGGNVRVFNGAGGAQRVGR